MTCKLQVTAIAFWPDGESLLLGAQFGRVVREAFDRRLIDPAFARGAFTTHVGAIDTILVDPGRRIAISGDRRDRITAWNLDTGEIRYVIAPPEGVGEMLLDRGSGRLFVAGGFSRAFVAAYDITVGQQIGTFDGHRLGVEGLALSLDGTQSATASRDSELRLWNSTPTADAKRFELGFECRSFALDAEGCRALARASDRNLQKIELDTLQVSTPPSPDTEPFGGA